MESIRPTLDRSAAHPDPQRIGDYAVGLLADAEFDTVERHLADCETCRMLAESAPDDAMLSQIRRAESAYGVAEPAVRVQRGFEVLEEIGRGGMAVVYKARQLGLGRIVALKRILSGIDAGADERMRFQREAEAAARLQHPNIVRIFEVGEQEGLPYIAMEYVNGGTLAEYLIEHPISARLAAELMETLSHAIHEAHVHGIVHRDLKPGNILLECADPPSTGAGDRSPRESLIAGPSRETYDLAGCTPKITDFGLAKRLDQSIADTHSGALLGTPAYMAPEQAAGNARRVGPAADIYGLGAILFELLTGQPPFRKATTLETLREVLEAPPIAPRRLRPEIPRDLETVCLKCLEKEPTRRYLSAPELADDLRRFLNGEPIAARAISRFERVAKWSRRRPAMAALIAVSAAGLMALSIGGWVANVRFNRQARITAQHYDRARLAIDTMLWGPGASGLLDIPEVSEYRLQLLNEARVLYEDLLRDAEHPDVPTRSSYARILADLGELYEQRDEREPARRSLLESERQLQRLRDEIPDDPELRLYMARVQGVLGEFEKNTGRRAEAASRLQVALDDFTPVARSSLDDQLALLAIMTTLHSAQVATGDRRGESLAGRVVEIAEKLVEDYPDDVQARTYRAMSLHNLAMSRLDPRNAADAENLLRRAINDWEQLAARDRMTSRRHEWMTQSYAGLASLCGNDRRVAEAVELLTKAIEISRKLERRFPETPQYTSILAQMYHNLGQVQQSNGINEPAETAFRQAVEIYETLMAKSPGDMVQQFALAESLVGLGVVVRSRGDFQQAASTLERAYSIQRLVCDREPAQADRAISLAVTCGNLSDLLKDMQRYPEALEFATRAIEPLSTMLPRFPGFTPQLAQLHAVRGQLLVLLGRAGDALPDCDRAIELSEGDARLQLRVNRALTNVGAGRQAAAVAEIENMANESSRDGAMLYNLACVYAQAAASVKSNPQAVDEGGKSFDHYADRAVELLRRAAAAGFFENSDNLTHMAGDPDLKPIEQQPSFRALQSELQSAQNPARGAIPANPQ